MCIDEILQKFVVWKTEESYMILENVSNLHENLIITKSLWAFNLYHTFRPQINQCSFTRILDRIKRKVGDQGSENEQDKR